MDRWGDKPYRVVLVDSGSMLSEHDTEAGAYSAANTANIRAAELGVSARYEAIPKP